MPKIIINLHYVGVHDGTQVMLMSGPAYTAHADFMNAWDPATMSDLTSRCIDAGINCKVATGDPAISSVAPAAGPVSGGQCVSIAGSQFQPGATVTFGSTPAVTDLPVQGNAITVDAPAGSGTVDVKVTNPDGGTATSPGAFTYSGAALVGPSPASGSPPGAVMGAGGGFELFDRTAAGTVQHTSWACPAGWSNTEDLGGAVASGPVAASMNAPQLQVFAQGTSNALMEKSRDAGGNWGSWVSLGGILASRPAAVSWGPGRIDTFVRGTDAKVWHKSFSGGAWSTWDSLGGVLPSGAAPAVASMGSGLLEVFVRGTDNAVWEKTWNGKVWSSWSSLRGVVQGDPAATSPGPNQLELFARGTDNALWIKSFTSPAWTGWSSLGGTLTSSPGAAAGGAVPTQTAVFAQWTDNSVWQLKHNGQAWNVWAKVP